MDNFISCRLTSGISQTALWMTGVAADPMEAITTVISMEK
jgi:hypothetical protein